MKIQVTDRQRSGIMAAFIKALGGTAQGRFFYIPEDKGEGYITGFTWEENELRMMVRNYYLNEEITLERTNELADGQEDVIFFLSGIFPETAFKAAKAPTEQPSVFICKQAVSSVLAMPSGTFFRSIAIAVSRGYLQKLFGNLTHPAVTTILNGKDDFAFETAVSPEMVKAAGEVLQLPVPEVLANAYCKLKCEELLCHIIALLTHREDVPVGGMHINDIRALYAIKLQLQNHPGLPPQIAQLAKDAGMSEPKLRKLFKQAFGKGVFEYYQSVRMAEAARLLREQHLSVGEVGYRLGFTNLSHFARVFEQYIGVKPKRYSVGEVSGKL